MQRHPIERYRHARGLRQVDLAERLGVSEISVRNWESGRGGPQGYRIGKIAEELGVDPVALRDEIDAWLAANTHGALPKRRRRVDTAKSA